jgi:integrase
VTSKSLIGAERRCTPVEEWPRQDQQQWRAALQAGDLLEEGGCRAGHSRFSNRAMAKGYGRWLAWAASKELLDDHVSPGDRITPDRVKTYVADLARENASGTVTARLIELKIMAGILDPGRDWSWIYRMGSLIRARHEPARPKRHRLVDITRLLDLGIDLMAGSEKETTRLRRFKAYRDGLMIALLASRPLRLRNLTGLVLDRTLVRRGGKWWIQIPADETKTKDLIERSWPKMLVPHLESYLVDHRAGIVALRDFNSGALGDALWLSMYGVPMTDNGIYTRIVVRTREGLGHPINPHLFRDCAVTSVAIGDPAHVGIAAHLLGHRTRSTTEHYYNQARSIEASRLMQNHLLVLRKGLVGQ